VTGLGEIFAYWPIAYFVQFFENYRSTGLPYGLFSNQKILIWVKFGGHWNGKGWCIL
jgi:hypothetical protein